LEVRKIEVETYYRKHGNLSSSGESPPIEQGHTTAASSSSYPIQPSEVQGLQEEVAKLKGKVQEMQGQIIEVAELREQIKIIQEQNFQEVIELREQIKIIQGQMNKLSVPSWHEHQWKARSWSQD
jgi:TolA-binding protein